MEDNNDNNSSAGEELDEPMQINWFVLIITLIAVIVFSSFVTSIIENNMKNKNTSSISNSQSYTNSKK